MVNIGSLSISPPLVNSACPWASDPKQLQELYDSPFTGGVTTRTATLKGYPENFKHTVAFSKDSITSINSYGYSPHPLSSYLVWVESIIGSNPRSTKPFIISIAASSSSELQLMIDAIQHLRTNLKDSENTQSRIAIELNTSCPNIDGSPPSGYDITSLSTFFEVIKDAVSRDRALTIGLKLPPYMFSKQFETTLQVVSAYVYPDTDPSKSFTKSSIAFFTCTNTLGNSLLFAEQTTVASGDLNSASEFAVPSILGGLGGESIHALSLGNVYSFRKLLDSSPLLKDIQIIGVGGVTTPKAVDRMRKAGAAVVGAATFLGREGVGAFEKLSKDLV